MKMTSSTSRISINGVTLMSAFADIFFIFFFIAGASYLRTWSSRRSVNNPTLSTPALRMLSTT